MAIKITVPETKVHQLKPRIAVIGVGGGGGNAVNNMIEQKLEGVDFVVANTDAQALANSKASRKIQLGLTTTQGLGAGARPEVGKLAAEEAIAEIEKEIEGANMVFITAGMGGGTGSGASPVVARVAKEKGALTVGVITKPFDFEGKKRTEVANGALEEFVSAVDSIIIIPNQNLFRVADKNTTLGEAFVMADNVLYSGVRSITDLMMLPGLINLDFADIQVIMQDKGRAIMGTGEAEGEDRASKAAEQALSNPLLDDCSMKGAKGVLINITGGNDITLFEVDEAVNKIKEQVDEDAQIIFGSSFDDTLQGKIRVSIVATGVGDALPKKMPVKEKIQPQPEPVKFEETYVRPEDYAKPEFKEENFEEPKNTETFDEKTNPFDALKNEMADNNTDQKFYEEEPELFDEVVQPKPRAQDFDLLERSKVMPDVPSSSALFNSIINKSDELNPQAQLNSVLQGYEKSFVPTTNLKDVQDNHENELFGEAPSLETIKQDEQEEELIVNTQERRAPTFIERLTGYSIAKRNKKKITEVKQEPIYPSFSDEEEERDEDEPMVQNLDIPSFLRRK